MSIKFLRPIVGCALILVCSLPAISGYSIDVNKAPDFPSGAGTIAILPPICPPDVDAIWVAETVAYEVKARYKGTVIEPKQVRQTMFEMGMEKIDDTNSQELAKKMGATSILVVKVSASGTSSTGSAYGTATGTTVSAFSFQLAKGGMEFNLVSIENNKMLMKAVGFGETDWKTSKGVLRTLIEKSLREAFGNRNY